MRASFVFQVDGQVDFGNSWVANGDQCGVTPEEPEPCDNVDEDVLNYINASCFTLLDPSGQ